MSLTREPQSLRRSSQTNILQKHPILKRFCNNLGHKMAQQFIRETVPTDPHSLATVSVESNCSVPVKTPKGLQSQDPGKPGPRVLQLTETQTTSNQVTSETGKRLTVRTEASKGESHLETPQARKVSMQSGIMKRLQAFFRGKLDKQSKRPKKMFLEDIGAKAQQSKQSQSSKSQSHAQSQSMNSNALKFPLEEKLLAREIYNTQTKLDEEVDIERIIEDKESVGLSAKSECLVFLKRGSLYLAKCLLTMNMHLRVTTTTPAAVYLSPGTKAVLSDCELRGGRLYKTTGLLSHLASLSVHNCRFFGHKAAGLKLILERRNLVSINFSRFEGNSCGVSVVGDSVKSEIRGCTISSNLIGVKIALESRILLSDSRVSSNRYGVLVVSADPAIRANSICCNQLHGVVSVASDKLLARPRLEDNSISYNNKFGVRVAGARNQTTLAHNTISFNRKGGVSVKNDAAAKLLSNQVRNNLGIGVLVHKRSSCHIERNVVSHSVKANIALCDLSEWRRTTVINNVVSHARCEGIVLLDCGNFLIA